MHAEVLPLHFEPSLVPHYHQHPLTLEFLQLGVKGIRDAVAADVDPLPQAASIADGLEMAVAIAIHCLEASHNPVAKMPH